MSDEEMSENGRHLLSSMHDVLHNSADESTNEENSSDSEDDPEEQFETLEQEHELFNQNSLFGHGGQEPFESDGDGDSVVDVSDDEFETVALNNSNGNDEEDSSEASETDDVEGSEGEEDEDEDVETDNERSAEAAVVNHGIGINIDVQVDVNTNNNDNVAVQNTGEPIVVAATSSTISSAALDVATSSNQNIVSGLNLSGMPVKRKRDSSDENIINIGHPDLPVCAICLEMWETTGAHRLVSLRCGHLFGESCIRRWLNGTTRQPGNRSCPQCKAKASPKDIRHIYAHRVHAIDRSEEYRLQRELNEENRRLWMLRCDYIQLKMSYSKITDKVHGLEFENQQLKRNFGDYKEKCVCNIDEQTAEGLPWKKYYKPIFERRVQITHEPGCRIMVHADHRNQLIISQKTPNSVLGGYGLNFIDSYTFQPVTFLHACSEMVSDICLSADQSKVALTSMETRAEVVDLRTSHIAGYFIQNEKMLWSCTMDQLERENLLYLGAHDGSVYTYDTRFSKSLVHEYQMEEDMNPVVNIAAVPANCLFPRGGLLICKTQSLWFYEFLVDAGSFKPNRLHVEGPFNCMRYDVVNETILLFARRNNMHAYSRFVFGKLNRIQDRVVFDTCCSFNGSKATPLTTRCCQIPMDDENTIIGGYVFGSKTISLYDTKRTRSLEEISVAEMYYDTCAIQTSTDTYIAALGDTHCNFYKLALASY